MFADVFLEFHERSTPQLPLYFSYQNFETQNYSQLSFQMGVARCPDKDSAFKYT
jgi:hypothetical protein